MFNSIKQFLVLLMQFDFKNKKVLVYTNNKFDYKYKLLLNFYSVKKINFQQFQRKIIRIILINLVYWFECCLHFLLLLLLAFSFVASKYNCFKEMSVFQVCLFCLDYLLGSSWCPWCPWCPWTTRCYGKLFFFFIWHWI